MPWIFLCPDPCGGQVTAKEPSGGRCSKCQREFESSKAVADAGGTSMHICTRGRRNVICGVPGCGRSQVALCDFPVTRKGKAGTCNARMCATHRTSVGPDRDYCPVHAKGTTATEQGGASDGK